MTETRVLVVDDHPAYRSAVVDTIKREPDMTVCGEADTVKAALAAIAASQPDVAVIDLSLGNESGFDVVSAVARTQPGVRMLVLSGHSEQIYAERTFDLGALGYLMKDEAASKLVMAIRRVAAGERYGRR